MSEIAKPVSSFKDRVLELEGRINQLPQVNCPVRHFFAPGLYAREISIPKGTVLTGAVHKRQNLAILSKGVLVMATEDGPKRIEAPHILTVQPGGKNVATAIEDAVWTNFFAVDETDPDKLVELLCESKPSELLGGAENIQLLQSGELMKEKIQ